MNILVGRGGNQSLNISDESVSKIHCKLEVSDSGMITLTNLSAAGTWLNDVKVIKRTVVKPTDELRLGPSFTVQVKDLLTQENYTISDNCMTDSLWAAVEYGWSCSMRQKIAAAALAQIVASCSFPTSTYSFPTKSRMEAYTPCSSGVPSCIS